jgi:DNA invertase Pin-like site-specific DNA recombinase
VRRERKILFTGYRRDSTDDQSENSQPRQEHAIENYAEDNCLERALHDFVDLGKSGTTVVGREQFHALMRAVAELRSMLSLWRMWIVSRGT